MAGGAGKVASDLDALGKTILGRPDVKADPRLKDVEAVVAALPQLIPKFGGALEDVLDAGLNAGDGAHAGRLAQEAIVAVDAYRKQLDGAPHLLAFEAFLSKEMGQSLALHQALDDTLVELRQELSSRV